MKQRFNKLLAVMLTASLCMPMLPTAPAQAASGNGVTFTEAESVSVSELGSERSTLFNEDWKFFLGNPANASAVNFNDASWNTVSIPHDFSIIQEYTLSGEGESGFLPGGTGWYRKKFTLPASCKSKSIVLNFDGVYKDSYVYVNGQLLGEHHYGYTPFSFDISDYVICDGSTENVIAVKADHQLPSSRWYSGSGIYRDVNLLFTEPVHVALDGTLVTTPDIGDGTGTVKIAVDVANDSTSTAVVTVRNTVYDADGKAVSTPSDASVTVNAGRTTTAECTTSVSSPALWDLDDPNLYTVRTELLVNGAVTDTYDSTFGFRWYSIDNTGFHLNGKNVKLNGVCMHHDQGALGSAAYYDAIYRQLSIMKEMGANAIRITHNPQCKQYLEICNELGLLAIEEFFDGWDVAKNGNSNDFSRHFMRNINEENQILGGDTSMTWAEFVLKSTVKRDRNNPSLIYWSLGNEIQEGASTSPNFPAIADNLIKWTKETDPSRNVTNGDNSRGGNATLTQVAQKIVASGGVVGFNYGNIQTISNLANQYGHIIASETASSTNSRGIYCSTAGNTNVDGKYHLTSYDSSSVGWGKTAHDSMWDTIRYDNIAGQFVWTGFDYLGEPTPWDPTGPNDDGGRGKIPNSSYFGIVETSGFPKDNYYLYRSQWKQDATTLHLVTAWDSDNMINNGGKTPVWVYSNAPVVKLYRDGTQVGTATRHENKTTAGHIYYTYTVASDSNLCTASNGANGASLYAVFNVAYQKGTISAKAFQADGRTEIPASELSGTTSVSTPDAVSKLSASVNKKEIAADGSSLAYVAVDVLDGKGALDTTATNEITFTLEGNGEILGVDNGDQATTKKYQQASTMLTGTSAKIDAFSGKALAIVRSTKAGGSFTVKASASGLQESAVTVMTVAEEVAENEITSYRMVKHFYAPVGSDSISLPASAEAFYSDGTTRTLPISWKDYDKANLRKLGNFKIDGSINDGKQTLDVYITGHMYDAIASVEGFSAMTKPGVIPELPATAMTYFADGTPFESFAVTWDLTGITADSFHTIGDVVTISGTVEAFGTVRPTSISIRVAEPILEKHDNVGVTASHVVDNGPWSDSLAAVNDGTKVDTGASSSRWSTWDRMAESTDGVITMCWDTATTTDQIDMYYFKENKANSQLPTKVKFEYTLNCTYDENSNTISSNEWVEVEYETPTELPGATNMTTGLSYKLKETINPIAIRITLGQDAGKYIGVNEIEILRPTESFVVNTSPELDSMTVGGQTISLKDGQTEYTLDIASISEITFNNPANAAVTFIQEGDNVVKVVAVSEDGKSTKTYTLVLTNAPTAASKQNLANKLNEYKALDSSNYTPESYEAFKKVLDSIAAGIDKMSEAELKQKLAELNTAYGKLVKLTVQPQPVPGIANGETAVVGKFQYKVTNAAAKTVTIVKGTNKKAGKVTIPATVKIKGVECKVIGIGANAFKGFSKLKAVVIGKNVTTIGKKAFFNCKKLKKVTFKGTAVKTVQSGAFKKTSAKMNVKVPKSMKKKQRNALKKKLIKRGMSKKMKLK